MHEFTTHYFYSVHYASQKINIDLLYMALLTREKKAGWAAMFSLTIQNNQIV